MLLALRAIETLNRRFVVVALFCAGAALLSATYVVFSHALFPIPEPGVPLPPGVLLQKLLLDLALAAAGSALYAVVFSAIGGEVAGRLWRFGRPLAALRRFLQLWLVLALLQAALGHAANALHQRGAEAAAQGVGMLFLAYSAALVPVGAALMYRTLPGCDDAAAAFAPYGRHPGQTALILLISLFALLVMVGSHPPGDAGLAVRLQGVVPLQLFLSFVDLLLFTWAFHLFRHDQATHVTGGIEL